MGDDGIVVIDEGEGVEKMGMVLKRMRDNFCDVEVVVRGCWWFDLEKKVKEGLRGGKFE